MGNKTEDKLMAALFNADPGDFIEFPSDDDPPEVSDKAAQDSFSQWASGGNDQFSPVGHTVPKLPAGVYEPFVGTNSWGLEKMQIISDGIYHLPDMTTGEVLKEVQTFWSSEEKYKKHKLLFKRGLLMHGPVGSGKTTAIKILMQELIKQDGVVIIAHNIDVTVTCLKALRRIEPKRHLIAVFEDIEEILAHNGESQVLSMLDGEHNIDQILHLATTNYPDRLGARIINRPSRFDRRIEIGMPSAESRKHYLMKATNNGLEAKQLDEWVTDTDQLSIAHLRELVAAVYCLGQPYTDVRDRLKEMAKQVKAEEEFKKNSTGFVKGGNKRHAFG
jgi:energy-coupling factor transporter ATP-binding protein EcfA2